MFYSERRTYFRDPLEFSPKRACTAKVGLTEQLVERYAFELRLLTLDALQLGVARELGNQHLVDHFVAADKVLCEVAAMEGFPVISPERF